MVHFVFVFCDRELQYEYSSFGLGGLLSPREGRIARCIGLIEGVMGTVPRRSGQ